MMSLQQSPDELELRVGDGANKNGVSEAYQLFATAGVALGAYHGYKRNNSIGWAVGWALLGGLFPFITIPISFAQGFGERKK